MNKKILTIGYDVRGKSEVYIELQGQICLIGGCSFYYALRSAGGNSSSIHDLSQHFSRR